MAAAAACINALGAHAELMSWSSSVPPQVQTFFGRLPRSAIGAVLNEIGVEFVQV